MPVRLARLPAELSTPAPATKSTPSGTLWIIETLSPGKNRAFRDPFSKFASISSSIEFKSFSSSVLNDKLEGTKVLSREVFASRMITSEDAAIHDSSLVRTSKFKLVMVFIKL
jgi:hypothetical protein